jgi:hypothetical protein
MRRVYKIGTDDWKKQTISDLIEVKTYLLTMSRDMVSNKLDRVISELEEHFKKNEKENRL